MELHLTTRGTWSRITHCQSSENTFTHLQIHAFTGLHWNFSTCLSALSDQQCWIYNIYILLDGLTSVPCCFMSAQQNFKLGYTQLKWRISIATVASLSHLIIEGEKLP